ncbi:hypothetical protein ONE63_003395 [Megalurothrips usitatus]|uniref:Uncharacterized protein n=1 Tax=Megalurothrips usitatus TaxID=439358 RepID=A0AAV7XE70_9NEOP|nr:hypothetical protein ONE63_003395 [Megalurothrips usitatus]
MAWTFKVLSVRPDLQESILQEVQGVLGSDKGIGTHHLARLEVTERVIKETLRLFPSVPMPARTASEELVLAGKTIPKHSTIFINVPRAHRDPRYWQDPLRFDPDRFLPERAAGRHPYAYLPFSSGPRRCIGAQYAMALIKTVVASVVLAFCVDPAGDGHDSPAHFPVSFAISSWMTGGTRVVFRPRCAAKNGDQHG